MKLTAKLVISARGLVGWTQKDLAKAAGVGRGTIRRLENDEPPALSEDSLWRIKTAFEDKGIEFLNHGSPGVRLRADKAQHIG